MTEAAEKLVFETSAQNRLIREIREGTLHLQATALTRYRFAFYIGLEMVGLYSARSRGPGKLELTRAWNRESVSEDPSSGLALPTAGRKFPRLANGDPLFLVEFGQFDNRAVDRVAFKAARAVLTDPGIMGAPKGLKFERARLEEITFLG